MIEKLTPDEFFAKQCPRQAGGLEAHRAQFLVHRVYRGRLVCMFAELAEDFDREVDREPGIKKLRRVY